MARPGSNPRQVYTTEVGPNPRLNGPYALSTTLYDSTPSCLSGVAERRPLPIFSAIPVPSEIQLAAQRRETAKAKRRVPPLQRKRTKLSCDACKVKRCKCLRTGPTPDYDYTQDDSHLAPCKNCVDSGNKCITTLPRKQRIYGSVEKLDRRYRALDALVSGLFSDLPSDATPEELVKYGRQRGVAMPDLGTEFESRKPLKTSSLRITSPSSPTTLVDALGTAVPSWATTIHTSSRPPIVVHTTLGLEGAWIV